MSLPFTQLNHNIAVFGTGALPGIIVGFLSALDTRINGGSASNAIGHLNFYGRIVKVPVTAVLFGGIKLLTYKILERVFNEKVHHESFILLSIIGMCAGAFHAMETRTTDKNINVNNFFSYLTRVIHIPLSGVLFSSLTISSYKLICKMI
jgi:hypothetical protein